MDQLLEKMAHTAELVYQVNGLMKRVGDTVNKDLLSNAEEGRAFDYKDLSSEGAELANKRKQTFELYNEVIMLIGELSREEKEQLANHIQDIVERNHVLLVQKENAYQNIIDLITSPGFSFEGNEGYKQKIIDLKEDYSRTASITQYYERIGSYLATYKRSK